jgi:hypothetical protein
VKLLKILVITPQPDPLPSRGEGKERNLFWNCWVKNGSMIVVLKIARFIKDAKNSAR